MSPDDGGSKDLWNVGKILPDYMAQQPRRQPSSYLLVFPRRRLFAVGKHSNTGIELNYYYYHLFEAST
jgi:hypothetical protein